MNQNPSENPVVIVGGGFAGLSTALELSRYKRSPPVVLFEPRHEFTFSPLLYELLSDEAQSWEVAPSYNSLLSKHGVVLIHENVEKIDTKTQTVISDLGKEINYDYLVIATGSKPQDCGVKGVKENAFLFNKTEDVELLRARVKELREVSWKRNNLVIVGAGFSGVELACKLADLLTSTTDIHLIEKEERILSRAKSFNREQAEMALKEKNIINHLQVEVDLITSKEIKLKQKIGSSNDSLSINYDCLIWTIGSIPNVPLICPSVPLQNGKILVNSCLRVKESQNLFAIGDLACTQGNSWPISAQLAIQQAKVVAKNLMLLRSAGKPCDFDYQDFGEMLSLGIGNASFTGLGLTFSGSFAFQIRRMAYLTRFPGLSLGLRSAGAWLLDS